MAEPRCSAGSPVRRAGFQTLSATILAAKITVFHTKTQVGPAAAMMKPAMAGPIAIDTLTPAELSVIAPARSERGTRPGMTEIQAGAASTLKIPSAAVRPNNDVTEKLSVAESNANVPVTIALPAKPNRMIRLRLRMSVSAPAMRARKKAGRATASRSEATSAGELVMSVSAHALANPVIYTAI